METKHEITVYKYCEGTAGHGAKELKTPIKMVVKANCVGGPEGVVAFFPDPKNPNLMCIANGDDGHWWYVSSIHKDWVEQIILSLGDFKELTIDMW